VWLASFAVACSSGKTPLPSEDGGVADASVHDAGGHEAAASEGGSDDAEADALATDALSDTEAPPPSHWCDGKLHAFCDDFDEDPLTQSWDTVAAQAGAVSLDGASFTSPAHSFLATSVAIGPGEYALARLGKRTLELATEVTFAFDLRADLLDPGGAPVGVSAIQLFDGLGELVESVNLLVSNAGAQIEDVSNSVDGGASVVTQRPVTSTSLVGSWSRVQLQVALPADAGLGQGTLTVTLGSQVVLDHVSLGASSQPALPVIFLGLFTPAGPAGPAAVRFDDVTFDAKVK
jgi:hypothetical protein